MLLLTGSLMAFTFTMHINSNRDGYAYIEIKESVSQTVVDRIPFGDGFFTISYSGTNSQTSSTLDEEIVYVATVYAHRTVSGLIYKDSDSVEFCYTTNQPHVFNVDISGNIPDDPPVQD